MKIREDFRRDGLAAHFMADAPTIFDFSRSIPGNIINIGYPSICEQERQRCKDIIRKVNTNIELAVVGHTTIADLNSMKDVVNGSNASANIWLPVSDFKIHQTLKENPSALLSRALEFISIWKKKSSRPLDIALTDCFNREKGLNRRIIHWTNELQKHGFRRVIICDSRGQAKPEQVHDITKQLSHFEFHPHNDNGLAIENAAVAENNGCYAIGTAFFSCGERLSMLEPKEILLSNFIVDEYNLAYQRYAERFGDPFTRSRSVYGRGAIITGTQHRLQARRSDIKLILGVTSDRYIANKVLRKPITSSQLSKLKGLLFYSGKFLYLDKSWASSNMSEYIIYCLRDAGVFD